MRPGAEGSEWWNVQPNPAGLAIHGYGSGMGPPASPGSTWILLVEDDAAIRSTLTRGLTEQGATVTAGGTAVEAIRILATDRPDAVMLDLGLSDLDGSDVLTMVRATSQVPVVIATARDDEREIVRLLDAGADDYLDKPFSATQAMARVRAVLRRVAPVAASDRGVVVGGLAIDLVSPSDRAGSRREGRPARRIGRSPAKSLRNWPRRHTRETPGRSAFPGFRDV
jgi:CheY-like chemotaxis protein